VDDILTLTTRLTDPVCATTTEYVVVWERVASLR
jgi:hypothetical protein